MTKVANVQDCQYGRGKTTKKTKGCSHDRKPPVIPSLLTEVDEIKNQSEKLAFIQAGENDT